MYIKDVCIRDLSSAGNRHFVDKRDGVFRFDVITFWCRFLQNFWCIHTDKCVCVWRGQRFEPVADKEDQVFLWKCFMVTRQPLMIYFALK